MQNVSIYDNGATYCITVDGFIVHTENTLGGAWRHIQWMYEIASQEFTVGKKRTPIKEWLTYMMEQGYMDKKNYMWLDKMTEVIC